MKPSLLWLSALLLAALVGVPGPGGSAQRLATPRLRRPIALALADHDRLLLVANRVGGITIIDTAKRRPIAEVDVGRRLSDVIVTPDSRAVLATDEEAHELVELARNGTELRVKHRLKVASYPVSVRVASDGRRAFVASLWSRRLTVVELAADGPRVQRVIPLPFAPREQLVLRGGERLIVADSFGGRLCVVNLPDGTVGPVMALPGHNVRGLALNIAGDRLLLAHQVLEKHARTTIEDIHWGVLMSNVVRALPLAGILSHSAAVRSSRLNYLGEPTRGAGDPSALAVAPDGTVIVAIGGTGEILFGPEDEPDRHRLTVGRRPTAIASTRDSRRAFFADTFGEQVAVVDLRSAKVEAPIALGPVAELGPAERGEALFYDARLSHDGWFSCHSCHTDGHSNSLLNDNFSDGSFGTPKRVLSLRGVGDTQPWAWNGSVNHLKDQIRKSIQVTMRGRTVRDDQVRDLLAYLLSLPPVPGIGALERDGDSKAVERGRAVFQKQRCAACHAPPVYTTGQVYDVGLADEAGQRRFNPPSLRGVSQGGPYFHDGRAATLEEVFTRYRHQLKSMLAPDELRDLIAFLRGL